MLSWKFYYDQFTSQKSFYSWHEVPTLGLSQCLRINKLCRIHGYIITLSLAFNPGDSLRGIPIPRFSNHPLFPIRFFWSMFPMPFSLVVGPTVLWFYSLYMNEHWKYFCFKICHVQYFVWWFYWSVHYRLREFYTKSVCPFYSNRFVINNAYILLFYSNPCTEILGLLV